MLTAEQKLRLAELAPPGYDIENARVLDFEGQVEVAAGADAVAVAEAALKQAGFPMVGTNGKPTVLYVTAWMAHADRPNDNRDAFAAADLEHIAGDLAQAPNLLVMDWNHSAGIPGREGPKAIGAWYAAEYAHNEQANAMGIRAKGVVWAWLFPEQANIMLGEQARNGSVAFSMTALPKRVEFGRDEQGGYSILREPVFFTLSALDVRPADPNCTGKVQLDDEDMQDMKDKMGKMPMAQSTVLFNGPVTTTTAAATTSYTLWISPNTTSDGIVLPNTTYIPVAPGQQYVPNIQFWPPVTMAEAIKHEDNAMDEELKKLQERVAALESEAQDKTNAFEALEVRAAELETARVALASELSAKVAELEQAQARITELEAELDTFRAEKVEHERKAVLAARLAELPETLRLAHAEREESIRERIERSWSAMNAEEWEDHKTNHLLFAFSHKAGDFVARSHQEGGRLPGGDPVVTDLAARAKRLHK